MKNNKDYANLSHEELLQNLYKKDVVLQDMSNELKENVEALKKTEAENRWLKEQLQLLKKMRMGKKSEKSDHGQLSLFNDIEEHADIETETLVKEEKPKQKPKKKKEADYNNLPTKDDHHELDDKTCVVCGSELKELAPTIVSTVEYQPARFVRKRYIIHHYVCKKCSDENGDAQIYDGKDAPTKLVDGSVVSPSVIAGLVFNKFVSGIPLYRQEQELQRKKIAISRANMSNWLMRVADTYLQPLYEKMLQDIRNCEVVHMDETTVTVLEDNRDKRSKSYEWLIMSGKHEDIQAVIYDYHPNREHIHAQEILGNNFTGYVHSDGYEAYHRLDNVVSVGCMAHVRRKFVEALEVSPIHKELKKLSKAKQMELIDANPSYKNILHIVYLIKKLFTHEHEYMKKKDSVEEIQANREKQDQDILDELLQCLKQHEHEYAPKSKMGVAITYALNQWEYVSNYIKDGRLELSNNRAERGIKPFVIGRKNWLFSNTKRGAHNSSLYYSLVESAKMNHLDIHKYFEYILNELKDNPMSDEIINRLLPYSNDLPDYVNTKKAS